MEKLSDPRPLLRDGVHRPCSCRCTTIFTRLRLPVSSQYLTASHPVMADSPVVRVIRRAVISLELASVDDVPVVCEAVWRVAKAAGVCSLRHLQYLEPIDLESPLRISRIQARELCATLGEMASEDVSAAGNGAGRNAPSAAEEARQDCFPLASEVAGRPRPDAAASPPETRAEIAPAGSAQAYVLPASSVMPRRLPRPAELRAQSRDMAVSSIKPQQSSAEVRPTSAESSDSDADEDYTPDRNESDFADDDGVGSGANNVRRRPASRQDKKRRAEDARRAVTGAKRAGLFARVGSKQTKVRRRSNVSLSDVDVHSSSTAAADPSIAAEIDVASTSVVSGAGGESSTSVQRSDSEVGRPRKENAAAGKGCSCPDVLKHLQSRFNVALRTKLESERMKRAGGAGEPSRYNYVRLFDVAVDALFDNFGNYVVHRFCAARALGVSEYWMTRAHKSAVEILNAPTTEVRRSDINPSDQAVLSRIVLPVESVLSVGRYLSSLGPSDPVVLLRDRRSLHGLAGKKSNNARTKAEEFFLAFGMRNSSPNGRTPDKHGRPHGTFRYFDAKYTLIVDRNSEDSASAFCNDVVRSMKRVQHFIDHPKDLVSVRTVERWIPKHFGTRILVDGKVVYNPNSCMKYPHKSDACSDCERRRGDRQSLVQTLRRHKQQSDLGTKPRQDVIKTIEKEIEDLDRGDTEHLEEAKEAVDHHKDQIKPAHSDFSSLASEWDALHRSMDPTEEEIEGFIDKASEFVFQMSCDFQQDKLIPSWNQSPQPGPTYYMSGITQYVLIFCMESCGLSTGPSKLSRNLAFVRDERVAGPKTCDDTLSAAVEALFGRRAPAQPAPPRYRTGYDAGGRIL